MSLFAKTSKPKTCTVCKSAFTPAMPMAKVCSPHCALTFARSKRGKAEKVAQVKDRRETKEKLEKHKRRGDLLSEAQTAFNKFIRLRDAGQTCICCGKPFELQRPGGSADAGHYLSRGAAPHLRFDERNVHSQRKNCNRPGGAKRDAFRAGMIARIGITELESLECDQSLKKYTDDDLRAIKAEYTLKTKMLKAAA